MTKQEFIAKANALGYQVADGKAAMLTAAHMNKHHGCTFKMRDIYNLFIPAK